MTTQERRGKLLLADGAARLLAFSVRAEPGEHRALWLAFFCNFVLFGDYYVLRPVRDTLATLFDVSQLNYLFMATFVVTLLCAPLYALLTARFRLAQVLPGLLWFWLSNVLIFALLLHAAPTSRLIAASYFVWHSVTNLYLISVFWTLMVELFTAAQATRLFAFIAAGGTIGAIVGPLITRSLVRAIGLDGLLFVAAVGLLLVIALVQLLIREKRQLQAHGGQTQHSTMDHVLPGTVLAGFRALKSNRYLQQQALFMVLMTWVATISYFLQTEVIARNIGALAARAVAIADIALVVNIITAVVLIGGVARFVRRFGLTATLLLNPIFMGGAFVALLFAPTVLMVQLLQVVRQVTQFAIARPSREICFAVLDQDSRYKAKNVIDTVAYRFGDVSASLMQAGLRALGSSMVAVLSLGLAASALWGWSALALGRRYEVLRKAVK